jgi:hypothetical protein
LADIKHQGFLKLHPLLSQRNKQPSFHMNKKKQWVLMPCFIGCWDFFFKKNLLCTSFNFFLHIINSLLIVNVGVYIYIYIYIYICKSLIFVWSNVNEIKNGFLTQIKLQIFGKSLKPNQTKGFL